MPLRRYALQRAACTASTSIQPRNIPEQPPFSMAPPRIGSTDSPRLSRSRSPQSRDSGVRHRSPLGNRKTVGQATPPAPATATKHHSSPNASQPCREISPKSDGRTVASPIGLPSPPARQLQIDNDLLATLQAILARLDDGLPQNAMLVSRNSPGIVNSATPSRHSPATPVVEFRTPTNNRRLPIGTPTLPPSDADREIRLTSWLVFHVSTGLDSVFALFRPRDIRENLEMTLADISLQQFRRFINRQLDVVRTDWVLSGKTFNFPEGRQDGELLITDDVQFRTYIMLYLKSDRSLDSDVCEFRLSPRRPPVV